MPLPPPPSLQAPSDPFALTAVFGDLDAIRRQVLELQERLAASQAEAAAAKRLQAQVGPAAPCLPADPAWQPHAYPHANFPPLESFLACQTLLVTHFHMLTPPPLPSLLSRLAQLVEARSRLAAAEVGAAEALGLQDMVRIKVRARRPGCQGAKAFLLSA
jgi:hypothetical protein